MPDHLSIVIPVLNEAACIVDTLMALAPLRAAGVEIIVADGGSRDETVRLSTPYADRVVAAPRGRARQMNAGAAVAEGGVLLFLHADTRLPDNAMTELDHALKRGAQWGRFDVQIDGQARMLRVIGLMMNVRSRMSGIATGDQAMFVRRAAFEDVGGFADYPLMEDLALSDALRKRWPPACLKAKVATSGRRWEQHGIWRTIILMWMLRSAFRLGVSPDVLVRHYR